MNAVLGRNAAINETAGNEDFRSLGKVPALSSPRSGSAKKKALIWHHGKSTGRKVCPLRCQGKMDCALLCVSEGK